MGYFINKLKIIKFYLGGNVHLLPDTPINGTLFLHQQQTLIPRWRRVALAFQHMNKDLKKLKYQPTRDDPNYVPDHRNAGYGTSHTIATAKEVLQLGDYELYKQYMPMPSLAVLYPVFRYLLWFFRIHLIALFYFLFFDF